MDAGVVKARWHIAPLLSRYAEVIVAFQILRHVQERRLRWQINTLKTILYQDSELARPLPRTGYIGENEVLRKNIYYLATKTQNVPDKLVLTLVEENVLDVDEGDLILYQPTAKLRAVKLYALLVEKEDSDNRLFSSIVSVMDAHENLEVREIFLERFNIARNTSNPAANEVGGAQEDENENNEDLIVGARETRWTCRTCTFINENSNNVCEMCSETVGLLNANLDLKFCPLCTLTNEVLVITCGACNEQPKSSDDNEDDN